MKNSVFIHVATIGRWREVFEEQIQLIKYSGLYDLLDSIYISVLGDGFDYKDEKLQIIYSSIDLLEWEFPTLDKLWEFACQEDMNILYIHGKGASEYKECIEDWRHYLQYFLIERHEDCLRHLEEYDICGCDWLGSHYFGNFWWARSSYLRTLKSPYDIKSTLHVKNRPWAGKNQQILVVKEDKKGYHYFDENEKVFARHYRLFAEMWIGSNECVKQKEMFKSNVMHLTDRFNFRKIVNEILY